MAQPGPEAMTADCNESKAERRPQCAAEPASRKDVLRKEMRTRTECTAAKLAKRSSEGWKRCSR